LYLAQVQFGEFNGGLFMAFLSDLDLGANLQSTWDPLLENTLL
jgi:hypothetical protein